jgi:glutaryl-CoA dehydrogenase
MKVRYWMENVVQPVINDYWINDEFPYHLIHGIEGIRGIDSLDIIGKSPLLTGLITMEMGRIDPSIATFYTIQNGLVIGTIEKLGTQEQKDKWLASLKRFDKIGCFAMTEPDVGSAAFDMKTNARVEGKYWILNGQKKWIGNSTWCDISIIWARDIDDGQIKGFIVENNIKGFTVDKIRNKFGLKVCQNGLITLDNVRVPKENKLNGSFKDILRYTRYLVGWEATGLQLGAYEHALKYAKERKQFGKPIASFQLIQDLLAKMLGNVTACQCMMFQLGKIDFTDAQAALAKAFTTVKARETVAWAREIFGANGMSIDYNIGRFFCDIEALYSYEGSYQMQNLIVGKSITGLSAFT